MSFNKVIVIGCPGAGKSTFARKLRDITGLPLYYLDLLWHKSDKTTVSRDEFDAELEEILAQDSWIIDGNYQRTLERRLEACNTVFLLDYPMALCLDGAKERVGRKREEMPWIEKILDENFRQRIEEFSQTKLPQIYTWLEQYRDGKNIIIFKSRNEADDYLHSLEI